MKDPLDCWSPFDAHPRDRTQEMTTHWTTPSEAADLVRSKPSKGLRLSLPFVTLVSSGTGGMDHISAAESFFLLGTSTAFLLILCVSVCHRPIQHLRTRSRFEVVSCHPSPALPVKPASLGRAKPAQLLLYTLYTSHTHLYFPCHTTCLLHFSFAFFE